MKLAELVVECQQELEAEKKDIAKEIIKERLQEIAACEKSLGTMKAQLNELLEKDISEVVDA